MDQQISHRSSKGRTSKRSEQPELEVPDIDKSQWLPKASAPDIDMYDRKLYPMRSSLQDILEKGKTEYALGLIILLNLILLIIESDFVNPDGQPPAWIEFISNCMLVFFSLEMAVRIYTYRRRMLKDPWAIADLLVITLDLVFTLLSVFLSKMPPVSMMRIVRLTRLARTTKIIRLVPQLHIIVLSLAGASGPLFWGGVMLILLVLCWSILAVQVINPIVEDIAKSGGFDGCDRCGRSYSTVWHSSITMVQQVIAGDSWGVVTLPVIEHSPWTCIFFMTVFITLGMALMNIILANVVDAVMQARLANDRYLADLRRQDRKEAKNRLYEICSNLDEDGSGCLSFDEFKAGYDSDVEFRVVLNAMDIKVEDLETVWGILDEDGSGDVSYLEFGEQLYNLRSSDSHTVLMFIKAYTTDLRRQMTDALKVMKHDIMGGLGGTLEVLKMMKTDDELLQRMAKQLNSCGLVVVDENHSQLESGLRDALPQEADVSCDPTQQSSVPLHACANQQAAVSRLNEQHCLAMCSSLESLSKLENKLESNIVALSNLINTAPRACSIALPASFQESSSCGEHRLTPKDDSWLPFVMCCKEPPSNFTTILHATSQFDRDNRFGRSLPTVPVDRAKCFTPRVASSDAKQA